MKHERNNLMKRSLEKWGRAPIILGVLVEHPLFWECSSSTHCFRSARRAPIILGVLAEHPLLKGAQALIVWRIAKQRAGEQLQNGHERNRFMKMLSWENEGAHPLFLGARRAPIFLRARRAPIFLRARAPIFQKGMSTHYSKSNRMENKWTIAKWTWKEWVHENALLKKWVRAPIIFGGSSTHYFGGSSTHLFRGARALTIQRTLI